MVRVVCIPTLERGNEVMVRPVCISTLERGNEVCGSVGEMETTGETPVIRWPVILQYRISNSNLQ
ncbi:MAG: hypothetical protein BMS9Abin08_1759 [Gammaproteobacteria bacterium]|nr:MAG: hypothetical protein BMS9Abin08_1759 [Gammaproteobacteria bacterium]